MVESTWASGVAEYEWSRNDRLPMLTPPDIASETIIAFLGEHYALRVRQVTFLPIGADANAAVFRVDADDNTPYFLKLKRGDFDEIAVSIPAYLRAHGIPQVMAPLATTTGKLWASGHGFNWILYPYFEGANGFGQPLSDAQWVAFGQSLRAIHASVLPPALASRVPREDYSPRWRDIVMNYDRQVETRVYDDVDDPFARRLAAFLANAAGRDSRDGGAGRAAWPDACGSERRARRMRSSCATRICMPGTSC